MTVHTAPGPGTFAAMRTRTPRVRAAFALGIAAVGVAAWWWWWAARGGAVVVAVAVAVTVSYSVVASLAIARLLVRVRALELRHPVTGLPNRRLVGELLPGRLALAERHDLPVVVAAMDLGGLDAGDGALGSAARAWRPHLRHSDIFGHVSGGELVLVLSGTSLTQAEMLLERLRAALPGVAFAAGLASWAGEPAEDLVRRAEDAMQAAGVAGAGRTVVAQIA